MPEKTDLTRPYEAIIQCIVLVNTIFDTTSRFIVTMIYALSCVRTIFQAAISSAILMIPLEKYALITLTCCLFHFKQKTFHPTICQNTGKLMAE